MVIDVILQSEFSGERAHRTTMNGGPGIATICPSHRHRHQCDIGTVAGSRANVRVRCDRHRAVIGDAFIRGRLQTKRIKRIRKNRWHDVGIEQLTAVPCAQAQTFQPGYHDLRSPQIFPACLQQAKSRVDAGEKRRVDDCHNHGGNQHFQQRESVLTRPAPSFVVQI